MKAYSFLNDVLVGDAFATGRLFFDVGEILHCAPDEIFGKKTLVAGGAVFSPDEAGGDVFKSHELQRLLAFDDFGDF